MPDRLQLGLHIAANALRGRIMCDEIGILLLQVDQLLHEPIVLPVGNHRTRLFVVLPVVEADFLAELSDALGGRGHGAGQGNKNWRERCSGMY